MSHPPDVVGYAEIALRAGCSTETVKSWRKRHRDFPEPYRQLAIGPVWIWGPVAEFIERHGFMPGRGRKPVTARS